ncbi:MAG: hypothetical protein V2A66_10125 [Pseudomonadota bacterium]
MKIVSLVLALIAVMAGGVARAETKAVPNVLSFQSLLFDDGGNPIADGSVGITFRVKDAKDQVLYEEKQSLDAVRGGVSALVGNGLNAQGAPAGGIPSAVLDPAGSRYLEAQVDGFPATSPMEIASVPYAVYANQALSAAEGAIDSKAIADGSIGYADLNRDLIRQLSSEITGEKGAGGIVFKEGLRDPSSAATIGVKANLVYSASNDLQGALADLDRAIKRRDEKIDAEATARGGMDATLQSSVGSEATARSSMDATLQSSIESEATARQQAEAQLQAAISSEAQTRQQEDALVLSQAQQNIAAGNTTVMNDINSRLYPSAWGSVTNSSSPVITGANVSLGTCSDGGNCEITFNTKMGSANYAVVVTGQYRYTIQAPTVVTAGLIVSDKTTDGFTIKPSAGAGAGSMFPFDFIVMGQ